MKMYLSSQITYCVLITPVFLRIMVVRIFVPRSLTEGTTITLSSRKAHYLVNVMRIHTGDEVILFNGYAGEWLAYIESVQHTCCQLTVQQKLCSQKSDQSDVWLLFSPIKGERNDFLIEKACELGVSVIWPLLTQRTVIHRPNIDKFYTRAVAAAEQCGRLTIPEIRDMATLSQVLAGWPQARRLIICDESNKDTRIATMFTSLGPGPTAVLIGPEGGFAYRELDLLYSFPFVIRVNLGPRILRSETAMLAILSCWQALCGDWSFD